MHTNLPDWARAEAYRHFRQGARYLMAAKAGDADAAIPARIYFQSVLEWATPEDWPSLWAETQQILRLELQTPDTISD